MKAHYLTACAIFSHSIHSNALSIECEMQLPAGGEMRIDNDSKLYKIQDDLNACTHFLLLGLEHFSCLFGIDIEEYRNRFEKKELELTRNHLPH